MFSVRVEWSALENYLKWEFKQEIVCVLGNGVCFLKSVKHCLEKDLDVNYTIDQISDKIFDEICDNSEMYTAFHTNSKRQLISDTLKYLNHRMYTMDIVVLLESQEYLWFYLTFWIAILDCGWKLHRLSIHTLVMLQKWLKIY